VLVRFHLDEHIPLAVAAGLRRRGIDVTCPVEIGLTSLRDEQQLSFASEEGRVLVTQDADFLRLHRAGVSHAGIAYCRQGSLAIGEMLRRLILMRDLTTAEEMQGRVEYL
jgi:predicted nuclease of predicted toxin-antitoxin system